MPLQGRENRKILFNFRYFTDMGGAAEPIKEKIWREANFVADNKGKTNQNRKKYFL